MYVYIYIYEVVYVCMHVCMYVCMCAYMYVCICAGMHAFKSAVRRSAPVPKVDASKLSQWLAAKPPLCSSLWCEIAAGRLIFCLLLVNC